jgi:ribonuclease HI
MSRRDRWQGWDNQQSHRHRHDTRTRKPKATHRPWMDSMDNVSFQDVCKVASDLGIADWDVLLIGDGSGKDWTHACGWGVILVDKHKRGWKDFSGGMSCGTISIAELFPYIYSLLWYNEHYGKVFRKQLGREAGGRPIKVGIITDSKYIADQGASLSTSIKALCEVKVNRQLWYTLMQFEREGYQLDFTWISRESIELNHLVDRMANRSRRAMKGARTPVDEDLNEVFVGFDGNWADNRTAS